MRLVHIIAAYRAAGELLGMRCRDIRENVIVDGNRGRMIAAAQAGDVPNLHIFRSRIGEATLQIGAQFASAIEAAAHVRANANFGFGRRHEMKMGIKTRNAVDLIKRRLSALRKSFKFRFGEEAVAKLDGPKVVEDHGAPSRAKSAGIILKDARREVAC